MALGDCMPQQQHSIQKATARWRRNEHAIASAEAVGLGPKLSDVLLAARAISESALDHLRQLWPVWSTDVNALNAVAEIGWSGRM